MALLKFFRGNKAKYNATVHADCVFFALDTKEILMNGNSFGLHSAGPGKGIQSVTYTAPNKITINYTSGAPDVVTLQNAEAGSSVATSKGGLMTPEQAYKLENISSGGSGSGILGVSVDGVDLVPVNGKVDIETSTLKLVAEDASLTVTPGSGQGTSAQPTKAKVHLDPIPLNMLQVTTDGLFSAYMIRTEIAETGDDYEIKRIKLNAVKPNGTVFTQVGGWEIKSVDSITRAEIGPIPTGEPDAGKTALILHLRKADFSEDTVYLKLPETSGSGNMTWYEGN